MNFHLPYEIISWKFFRRDYIAVKDREEMNTGDILSYWLRVNKYRTSCVNSEDSDQPVYSRTLVRPYHLHNTYL